MAVVTEPFRREDWDSVRAICEEGIATGHATFEEEAPNWEAWNANHLATCRLVARDDDTVIGWAALSPVSERCVYEGVAETSVYVSGAARGRGIGRELLIALITGVGGRRDLDAAGRYLPGECRQSGCAQSLRLSGGWAPRANRQDG